MIQFVSGDLFNSDTEAIVNTVNCIGVMGRGIALQFKKQYPDNFKSYEMACKHNEVVPGKMFVFKLNQLVNPKYIINFPTKRHWRGVSRIEDIQAGLADLVDVIRERRISSIALPPLGSGLGGLDWNLVRKIIESAFISLSDVNIIVFEPSEKNTEERKVKNTTVPKMTAGRAALVCLAHRYLGGLLDPFVSLLELHKLMYFLQECGEPLRLKYVKAFHGPYAENLSHVMNAIEGHLLFGYADGGDKPDKQIKIVPGAEQEAYLFIMQKPDTSERINRVTELVDGFETPFGMELLSTVHWAVSNGAKTMPAIMSYVYGWGLQKNKFSHRQITITAERLANYGWISINGKG